MYNNYRQGIFYIKHNKTIQKVWEVYLIIDKITYDNMVTEPIYRINRDDFNIDTMKLKKALNNYNDLLLRTADTKSSDLYALLECISAAIKNSSLTIKQKQRIALWMDGKTEKEIAVELDLSEVTVHNSLVQSVKKISRELEGIIEEWFG